MKRLLCIWLPNWPVQRLRAQLIASSAEREHVSGQPIVLWSQDPRRGRLVAACCDQAAAMGVRPEMPIAQASEMARYGGDVFTCQHDRELDRQGLDQVANVLQKHITPLVSIERLDKQRWDGRTIHQPQAFLCDITGVDHLFGGEQGLLQTANQQLAELGLNARSAIANSAQSAWSLAHYHRDKTIFPVDPTSADMDVLKKLPVQALRIPPPTTETLSRLGVTHVGQLLRLPRAGLATRLGEHLVTRISQLLCEVDETLSIHRPPAEYSASLTLEYPTADTEILSDRIGALIEKVRTGMATGKRGALRLACRLALADHPPLILEVGFFAPTLDTQHILGLVLQGIENRKMPAAATDIWIDIPLTAPMTSSQNSLFAESAKGDSSSLSRVVDALSSRLGRESVLGVKRSENPLPEKAFELFPLTGRSPKVRHISASKNSASKFKNGKKESRSKVGGLLPTRDDSLRRPLSLLNSPVPIFVVQDQKSTQFPTAFRLGGKTHNVVRYWGPEKIETGWWHGPSIRRDYYRIETDHGSWWWVYRNMNPDSSANEPHRRHPWMLQGKFE